MKLRIAIVATLAVVLVVPGLAAARAAAPTIDRGVVQSVSATEIVLRALDGSLVQLAVGPLTTVRLNGAPSHLAALRPGFVAEVTHRGDRPAGLVRAFGRVKVEARGVVTVLSVTTIEVRTAAGTVTIPLTSTTRFRRHGLPVKRAAAGPGALVTVVHDEGGPARVIRVLRRAVS
jgi:hypothetical protein